jgi:hypothetical protein
MKCWLGTQGIEVGGRRWNRLALIMMISLGMDRDRDNLDGWMRNDIRDIILGDEFESACLISYFLRLLQRTWTWVKSIFHHLWVVTRKKERVVLGMLE